LIGVYLLPNSGTRADRKTVMRVMAFACSPGILRLIGIIPHVAGVVFIVSTVWIIAAGVVGIKKAFNMLNTTQAVLVCAGTWIVSFFVQSLLLILLFSIFGVSRSIS
jgi:hypothetical protein